MYIPGEIKLLVGQTYIQVAEAPEERSARTRLGTKPLYKTCGALMLRTSWYEILFTLPSPSALNFQGFT